MRMFWDSVYTALNNMNHWEFHFVILMYLSLLLAPAILIFLVLKHNHALSIKYVRKLFLPLFEAVAISVIVLTLFPIIFGMGDDARWDFPVRIMQLSPGGFVGLMLILIVIAYLIDIVPKLRKLQSFKTLILGGITLIFVRFFLSFINPVIETDLESFIPGFWFACGIIIISVILSKLGHFVFEVFAEVLGNKFDLREEVAELLILPVIATLGFLPVFIYGAWLA
ncbi:MAG: hypothetical protein ABFR82_11320 [Nitrospirota bacterium]